MMEDEPLKLYFLFPGELGREPTLWTPIQLSGPPVRGEVEGEPGSPGRPSEEEPLGEAQGDCQGEFWGEIGRAHV